ncbi:MAG: glycosyltransferase family 4 protein [Candidatus Omnitrophica bacterium]|nr:glycosyltransferase family 4 protein [Candidatus Omnitrophota bacterium]MDD5671061.1 glycosyltransferase family 4 protein [Candidatus Omnitrophota bacterium]
MVRPFKKSYTETFIDAQIEGLPERIRALSWPWARYPAGRTAPAFGPIDPARHDRACSIRNAMIDLGFATYLATQKPDVVLAHFGPTGATVYDRCWRNKIPCVVSFYGFDAYRRDILQEYGAVYRRMFEKVSAMIVVSGDMLRQLIRLGASSEKIIYNPCGVDTEFYHLPDVPRTSPHVITVGRFIEKKGPQMTLRAFREVLSSCPDAKLTMVGEGVMKKDCERMASGWGISRSVRFPGKCSRHEIRSMYANSRVFVQHSMTASDGDSEGTPVAVLEAAATGLPVVSTRHGGIPEAVLHGESGYLVDEGDTHAMAQSIAGLLKSNELTASFGQCARRHICARFSFHQTMPELRRILEAAVENKTKSD